jgi:hypothetical protein
LEDSNIPVAILRGNFGSSITHTIDNDNYFERVAPRLKCREISLQRPDETIFLIPCGNDDANPGDARVQFRHCKK